MVAIVMRLKLWNLHPSLNPKFYWILGSSCSSWFTFPDRLSLLSFLCLLAGERSKFLIRLVNPSWYGMVSVGTPGRKKSRERCLEQQLNPLHTQTLCCRAELLLSGHVGTNLRVTGLIFPPVELLSDALTLMSSHYHWKANDCWAGGAGSWL